MVEVMYRLCNANSWFTDGNQQQYDKLFEMVRAGKSSAELSAVIWVCSVGWSQADIYRELVKNGFRA